MKALRVTVLPTLLFLVLALAAPVDLPAGAIRVGPVEAELIARERSVRPGQPFLVAVRLRMDEGWHTYWKNPGDAGLPTTVTWELPAGFSAGPIRWPVPRLFREQDFSTYGYEEEALLVVEMTPPADLETGTMFTLRARVSWLACRVECLPGWAALSLNMPATEGEPVTGRAAVFDAALASMPMEDPAVAFTASLAGGALVLRAVVPGMPPGSTAVFYPGLPGLIENSAVQRAAADARGLTLHLERSRINAVPPVRLQGVLVAGTGGEARAFEVDAPVSTPGAGLLVAIVLAFLGGLLLNLMPCVLPVLSLKVLSLVRHAPSGRRGAVAHGLSFSAGVLVSFWLIAGLLIALRAGGQLLGWGFQFQSPGLVAAVGLLFFLVGLNLFGVFEIGAGAAAVGAGLGQRKGWAGSFFSGFLATAVATPCTAPFMGSALGYALSQPPAVSFAVFTALGIGMALPYLVLSAAPGLVKRVPRPGRWMDSLKQAMGFPMMAAVVWMASVLLSLSGTASLFALLAALVAAGIGAWVWGRWGSLDKSRRSRIAAGIISISLVAAGAGLAIGSAAQGRAASGRTDPTSGRPGVGTEGWEPWSQERLAELRAGGRPVFIDFSAEWCLTCKVNEAVVLQRKGVLERFRQKNVVLLRADWTDRSDSIARAIAGYGRAGVPLYVLYVPGAAEPVLLPELLTPSVVLAALDSLP